MEIEPCVNTEIEHLLYRCLSTNVHGNRDLNVKTSGACRGWINEEKCSLEICYILEKIARKIVKEFSFIYFHLFTRVILRRLCSKCSNAGSTSNIDRPNCN